VDTATNLYVTDSGNNTIRKLRPAGTNWIVTTLAGMAGVSGSSDGTGSAAKFNSPAGIAVDSPRNLYVADNVNRTIRRGHLAILLQISLVGNRVVISWPLAATNFVLESSAALGPSASWSPQTNGVLAVSGDDLVRTNNVGAGALFYRLHTVKN